MCLCKSTRFVNKVYGVTMLKCIKLYYPVEFRNNFGKCEQKTCYNVQVTVQQTNPFNSRAGHCSGRYSFGHNSPAAAATEVFKPSTYSASRLILSQNFFSVLGLEFASGDVTSGGVLAFYGLIYPALGANPMNQCFGTRFCLKRDYLPSL